MHHFEIIYKDICKLENKSYHSINNNIILLCCDWQQSWYNLLSMNSNFQQHSDKINYVPCFYKYLTIIIEIKIQVLILILKCIYMLKKHKRYTIFLLFSWLVISFFEKQNIVNKSFKTSNIITSYLHNYI